jgi:hypothetical protein
VVAICSIAILFLQYPSWAFGEIVINCNPKENAQCMVNNTSVVSVSNHKRLTRMKPLKQCEYS